MMIKKHFPRNPPLLGCAVLLLILSAFALKADDTNLFAGGTFQNCTETYNPWAGVDGDGNIHGIPGTQYAVGDDGKIYGAAFGPSIAVGDLNGDGKPDLVLADSKGFFWYFPNSGTAKEPKFTRGQIMPVWLGEKKTHEYEAGSDNIVPRIQLVDLDNSGKLSLVVGTYAGKLFYVPNIGSTSQPNFPLIMDPDRYLVGTHAKGALWCNYLAPFLCHWFGPNLLDLVMGEGTYSANSIYLFQNTNSNTDPGFTEANMKKIIPGMGLEQLTPTVVDWNNDGKPDILAGDRTGYLNLFLNTSTDPAHPTFAPDQHVSVGGNENLGKFTTVTTCDLTGNKLPNLLIGTDAGTIISATNTGKLGAPDFSSPTTLLHGDPNPFPKIMVPNTWTKYEPPGVPDELVVCTNPELEPKLTMPPGSTSKYVLKFFLFPITDPIFTHRFYPVEENDFYEHDIYCNAATAPVKAKTRYKLHLWVKSDSNVQDIRLRFRSTYATPKGYRSEVDDIPISTASDWVETDKGIEFKLLDAAPDGTAQFSIEIRFQGQGTLYVDEISLKAE